MSQHGTKETHFRSQRIECLDIAFGEFSEKIKVEGFIGLPAIDCPKHGTKPAVYVYDISKNTGRDVWVCCDCFPHLQKRINYLKAKAGVEDIAHH